MVSPARGAGSQLPDLAGGEGRLAAGVGAAGLGQRDPLPLAFAGQRPLELGEGPSTDSSKMAIGESSPLKVSCSLTN